MKLKIAVFSLLFISMVASIAAGEQNASESSNNWRGPYAGISIGYINGDTAPDVKVKEKGYFVNDDPGQLNPLASKGLDANDFLGALLLGYSFQRGPVVIGLEADFSLMDYKEQNSTGNINYITSPTNTFSITTKVETRWAANLRMRLGYVWKNSLFFITGGPSWTELDYSFLFTDTFTP